MWAKTKFFILLLLFPVLFLFPLRRQRTFPAIILLQTFFICFARIHTSASIFCNKKEKLNEKKRRKYSNRSDWYRIKIQSHKPLPLLSTVIWIELPNTKRYSHTNFTKVQRERERKREKLLQNERKYEGIEQSRSKSVANKRRMEKFKTWHSRSHSYMYCIKQ